MAKSKKKLSAAQKRARKKAKEERQRKYMWIFMNGKQVRIKRPLTIEGMDPDDFIRQNADPIWLHQNEMWEYIDVDEQNHKFDFKEVSISIAGDYYQVLFTDGLDTENEPYFLIQRGFEFSDGDECYFESHREELIGHIRVISATLTKSTLRVLYDHNPIRDVEIQFLASDAEYNRLASTLAEMIPEISIDIIDT